MPMSAQAPSGAPHTTVAPTAPGSRAASPGKVYLVGAGPGAADLLTVRAMRLLARADIVLHDALVGPDILEMAPQAQWIPVGKRCGQRSSAQAFINKQLVDAARRHPIVVRLKGGDPMLFGRAQEEIAALQQAGIEFEVVPGISAAFGAASAMACSLTQRGISRSVCFLTPAVGQGEAPHAWAQPAVAADTVVLYMASRQAAVIQEGLLQAGLPADRPVALIENASLPQQAIHQAPLGRLAEIAEQLGGGPALIVIGDVLTALRALPAKTKESEAAAPLDAPTLEKKPMNRETRAARRAA